MSLPYALASWIENKRVDRMPEGMETLGRELWKWRFGKAEFDEGRLELRRLGVLRNVERKPLELLMVLLQHAGEVVTKAEIQEALWEDRVLSETVITTCVAKLRSALQDDDHSVVKTVHGFGYRLAVEVQRDRIANSLATKRDRLDDDFIHPLRPHWRLVHRYGESQGENWQVENSKTKERRIWKLALDAAQLIQIKREITVHRLLQKAPGSDHSFVKLLDWNLESVPYFAEFEFLTAGSLTDWLAAQGGASAIPLESRLELVARIADALALAHASGVLHKDIKPSNILIKEGDGIRGIRLADFGSGRIVDLTRLEALEITQLGFTINVGDGAEAVGTWGYMAPEVVRGQLPTVRSDIFSLGVLLYGLTVGDIKRALGAGWERHIDDELLREDVAACCDVDPMHRLGDALELGRRLRALPKRRQERDIERQNAERERTLTIALMHARTRRRWMTAIAMLACISLAVILPLYIQVGRARSKAQQEAAASKTINEYLVEDLISALNPIARVGLAAGDATDGASSDSTRNDGTSGNDGAARTDAPDHDRAPSNRVPVRQLLDRAAQRAAARFKDQPGLEGRVRMSLGDAYFGLAGFKEAAEQFLRAHDLFQPMRSDEDLAMDASALFRAGLAFSEADDFAAAGDALNRSSVLLPRLAANDERMRLAVQLDDAKGWLHYKLGEYDKALQQIGSALPGIEREFGAQSEPYATALVHLANTQISARHADKAVASARAALALRAKLDGPRHPAAIRAHALLSEALRMTGGLKEAEAEARTAFDMSAAVLGPDHADTLLAEEALASVVQQAGRNDESIKLMEDTFNRSAKAYGEVSMDTNIFLNNLSIAYADAGRTSQAIELMQRCIANTRKLLGPDHADVLVREHNMSDFLADANRWQEARDLEESVLPRAKAIWGAQNITVAYVDKTLARIYLHFSDAARADAALTDADNIVKRQPDPSSPLAKQLQALKAALLKQRAS